MMQTILAWLASGAIRTITGRCTYRVEGRHHLASIVSRNRPILFAFFHGQQLMLFGFKAPSPVCQMTSFSKDGALQTRILDRLGFTVVRGSPKKRGMVGLEKMIGYAEKGMHCALAVDGSHGPYHVVKPGIIRLAARSKGLILPVAAVGSRTYVFEKAWDRYTLPLPGSQITVRLGEPMDVSESENDRVLENIRIELERRLIDLSKPPDEWTGERT